jgi:hypothetical protein
MKVRQSLMPLRSTLTKRTNDEQHGTRSERWAATGRIAMSDNEKVEPMPKFGQKPPAQTPTPITPMRPLGK